MEMDHKKCMRQRKDGLYFNTTQRYIDVNSDQLNQTVELLWQTRTAQSELPIKTQRVNVLKPPPIEVAQTVSPAM